MEKTHTEAMVLRTCDVDFKGYWRPGAIMTAVQETSGAHVYMLGCGREALLRQNLVWITIRCTLHMNRYPVFGDWISVESVPIGTRRWFFPRYCLFRNQMGELLGYSSTLWGLLDIEKRRMMPPGSVGELIPDNAPERDLPMGMPGPVEKLEGEETVFQIEPQYYDLDMNGHVSNTRYVDWACDALGIDVMRDCCLDTITVDYHAEVRPEQTMTLHLIKNGLSFRVAGYHGEKMHFEIGGSLRKR